MLNREHMTVEVGHPAPPLNSEIEKADCIPDDRLDLALEERRIPLCKVSRVGIAELVVEADLGELVEQRVQFAGV